MPGSLSLAPVGVGRGWQRAGRCGSHYVETFFEPDDDARRMGRRRREHMAREICQGCPVRQQCAGHALQTGEKYGIWGGLTEQDRADLGVLGWRDAWNARVGGVNLRQLAGRLAIYRAGRKRDATSG